MDIDSTARDAVVAAVGAKLARAAFREELREAEARLVAYANTETVPHREFPGLETALALLTPDHWRGKHTTWGVPEATRCVHGNPFAWQGPNAEPVCRDCLVQSRERHKADPRAYVNPKTGLAWTRCQLCTKAMSYYTHTTNEMIAAVLADAVAQLEEMGES
jgi:hypothetical protein